MLIALLLTALALSGAAIGINLGESRGLPPRVAAAGGGLLFGISLFYVLPEIAERSGWLAGALGLTAGAALLWGIDRFLYPICPACSHSHDHSHCDGAPLHGFAAPLLIAAGIHSLLDGWTVRVLSPDRLIGIAAPLGLALHKIPEGFALGLISRESMRSARLALLGCVAAESATLVGAFIEPFIDHAGASHFGAVWVSIVLALTGGSFLFLGVHTIDGSRGKPGVFSTFFMTLSCVAGIALWHWRFGTI